MGSNPTGGVLIKEMSTSSSVEGKEGGGDNMGFWIVTRRTLWFPSEEFGVLDIVTDENGYKNFDTVEKAKEYAELNCHPNYLIVELKG